MASSTLLQIYFALYFYITFFWPIRLRQCGLPLIRALFGLITYTMVHQIPIATESRYTCFRYR